MDADGEKKHMQFQLDNEDLAKMLNYASEPKDIDERLLQDFPLSSPNHSIEEPKWDELALYDEPVSLPREEETPKIKIKIIPAKVLRTTSRKKRPYTYHGRRRSLRKRIRSPRLASSKRLITGKLPSKRPKTMRIKLHPVKQQ
jgi:hypothetical protein